MFNGFELRLGIGMGALLMVGERACQCLCGPLLQEALATAACLRASHTGWCFTPLLAGVRSYM